MADVIAELRTKIAKHHYADGLMVDTAHMAALLDDRRIEHRGRFPRRPMTDAPSQDSFKGWSNSGIAAPGGCLTLNTSTWPSDGRARSLSDVLETGPLPQRYFLSARACAGILRRAERRGKTLPRQLHEALATMAGHLLEETAPTT